MYDGTPLILYISGHSGAGKTTLASLLEQHYGIIPNETMWWIKLKVRNLLRRHGIRNTAEYIDGALKEVPHPVFGGDVTSRRFQGRLASKVTAEEYKTAHLNFINGNKKKHIAFSGLRAGQNNVYPQVLAKMQKELGTSARIVPILIQRPDLEPNKVLPRFRPPEENYFKGRIITNNGQPEDMLQTPWLQALLAEHGIMPLGNI